MVLQPLLGPSGKVPILIRDDDTNFFTKPSMIHSIYSRAWEKGLKISFAVVPLQLGSNNISVPPEIREKKLFFPVADNNALVEYIKDKVSTGKAEVLQHGLSHYVDDNGHWEFGRNLDAVQDIERGRKILIKAFDTSPKFFVPPGEEITKYNFERVVESGLVPICRKTRFDTFLENPFVPNYIKQVATKYVAGKYKDAYKDEKMAIQSLRPVVITMNRNYISWNVPIKSSKISSTQSLFDFTNKVIQKCKASRSPICIINHYHFFYYDWNSSISRAELFRCWNLLMDILDSLEFGWFATFSDLYERSKHIQNIQIAETGSKIAIESKVHVRNFSFRLTGSLEPNDSYYFDKDNNIITIEDLIPDQKITLYKKN